MSKFSSFFMFQKCDNQVLIARHAEILRTKSGTTLGDLENIA